MKTFRRSFWKASTSRVDMLMMLILDIVAIFLIYWATSSVWACLLMLLLGGAVCEGIGVHWTFWHD